MSEPNYFPLLILPLAGLAILIVVWLIIAADRRHRDHHTPAE